MTHSKSYNGYMTVKLSNKTKSQTHCVHRLMAEAFIEKPSSSVYLDVDHINFIRNDNRLENLQWLTHKQNCNRKKDKIEIIDIQFFDIK